MRQKISQTTVETDTFGSFDLRFEHEISGNKLRRLTCNAIPSTPPGEPIVGNAFFMRNDNGTNNTTFNQLPVDADLANYVANEFEGIVSENIVPSEPVEEE